MSILTPTVDSSCTTSNCGSPPSSRAKRREDLGQNRLIEAALIGQWRRLDGDNRNARRRAGTAKLGSMLGQKVIDQRRLAVVGFTHNEQIRHAMRRGQLQQVVKSGRDLLGPRIADPAAATNLGDPLF